MRATLLAVLVLLIAPASALGGGWATVGLSSTPNDTAPGEPWNVELTILQHGRTPLEGVDPAVIVRDAAGGQRRRFAASPTGRPGVYGARVVFPSSGVWQYEVDDGFVGAVHDYPPVRIGEGAASPSPSQDAANPATPPERPDWGLALLAAGAAALGGGFIAHLLGRWRRVERPAEG